MELQADRQEITVRLLQNGRYTWTITTNTKLGDPQAISIIKQMDGTLADQFPNHVKINSVKFSELDE